MACTDTMQIADWAVLPTSSGSKDLLPWKGVLLESQAMVERTITHMVVQEVNPYNATPFFLMREADSVRVSADEVLHQSPL